MNDESLESIYSEINKLQNKAENLRNKVCQEYGEYVKSCEWIADVVLIFQFGYNMGMGQTYKFVFGSTNPKIKEVCLGFYSSFSVYGDSTHYQNNIVLRREDHGFSLSTDNAKTLCDFLDAFSPKISPSSLFEDNLMVFNKIKEYIKKT